MKSKMYPRIDSFSPIQCVSSKVLKINRLTANIFRKHLSSFGVTDSQVSVLFILSKRPNMTQQQLSNMTQLDKSTMSRNLQRLYTRGYVSKQEFPRLRLSEQGMQLVHSIIPAWESAMAEMKSKLDDQDIESLDRILNKLTDTPPLTNKAL